MWTRDNIPIVSGVVHHNCNFQQPPLATRWNFLGVELRPPLVAEANAWRDAMGLRNVHFVANNANVGLAPLLKNAAQAGLVQRVCVQFPDPWAKACHRKRRIVQPAFVADLAALLPPGGEVYVCCDYEELFEDMLSCFGKSAAFARDAVRGSEPLELPSERDILCRKKGRPVYRAWFTRIADGKLCQSE